MPSGRKLNLDERIAICRMLRQRDSDGRRLLTHQQIADQFGVKVCTITTVVIEAAIEWGKLMEWQTPPGSK